MSPCKGGLGRRPGRKRSCKQKIISDISCTKKNKIYQDNQVEYPDAQTSHQMRMTGLYTLLYMTTEKALYF